MKKEKLTCEKAKQLLLVSVLKRLGIIPAKETNNEAWFLSPFHIETIPSFKVSKIKNAWYDHSLGIGGNVIDLIVKLKSCSVKEALIFLNNDINLFSFHQPPFGSQGCDNDKSYYISNVKELKNYALTSYLKSRGIKKEEVYKFCKEIHYLLDSRNFFAIAFKNSLGGYEIRNKYIKGCLGKKSYSVIKNDTETINVFEGFIDFLSFIQLGGSIKEDFLILNSVATIGKSIPIINQYKRVNLWLDNDTSGKQTCKLIMNHIPRSVDFSSKYKNYKDLNDLLCAKTFGE